MNLDALFPYAGAHAIQSATFIAEWKEALTGHELRDIKLRFAQRLQKFAAPLPMHTLSVEVGPTAPSVPVRQTSESGWIFQLGGGLGEPPRRTVQIGLNLCIVTVNDYSTWEPIQRDVNEYFEQTFAVIGGSSRELTAVGLQFMDVFNWKAEPDKLDIKQIFKPQSPYLAPRVLSLSSYWHCHFGFFEPCEAEPSLQQLNNVNASRVATDTHDAIRIQTTHKADLLHTWGDATSKTAKIQLLQEAFHTTNKQVLRELLSDAVCEKIQLNTRGS